MRQLIKNKFSRYKFNSKKINNIKPDNITKTFKPTKASILLASTVALSTLTSTQLASATDFKANNSIATISWDGTSYITDGNWDPSSTIVDNQLPTTIDLYGKNAQINLDPGYAFPTISSVINTGGNGLLTIQSANTLAETDQRTVAINGQIGSSTNKVGFIVNNDAILDIQSNSDINTNGILLQSQNATIKISADANSAVESDGNTATTVPNQGILILNSGDHSRLTHQGDIGAEGSWLNRIEVYGPGQTYFNNNVYANSITVEPI